MNKQIPFRTLFIAILSLYPPTNVSHSVTFDDSMAPFNSGSWMDEKSILHVLDFNGDGYNDLLVDGIEQTRGEQTDFFVLIDQAIDRYYDIRNSVSLTRKLFPQFFASAILPHWDDADRRDSIVAVRDRQMKVVRYIKNEDSEFFDQYETIDYELELNKDEIDAGIDRTIRQIRVAAAIGSENGSQFVDLFVIASQTDGKTKLFLFDNPFYSIASPENPLPCFQSLPMPGIPETFWIGKIDEDERADIFFEYAGLWYIWLANASGQGFNPTDTTRSFTVTIPTGVKRAVDIGQGVAGYRLFVSVECESDCDVTYVAFPDDSLSRPIPIRIGQKSVLGNRTRMFTVTNTFRDESYPLFIVYNPLDEQNPRINTFHIFRENYRIHPSDKPLQPILIQNFQPDYQTNSHHFFFDRPELLADIDGDGVSDLFLRGYGAPIGNDAVRYEYLGFKGVGEAKIPNWSVYE